MPNNFRILPVGAYFISKEGSDGSVTPQDPNTPKATLAAYAASGTMVVGCGVYKGAIVIANGAQLPSYIADGTVVISASGGNILSTPNDNSYTVRLNTELFNSHTIWILLNGFSYTASRGQYHNNVVFQNGSYSHTGTATTTPIHTKCVYESITFSSAVAFVFTYCKLFNSTFTVGSATTLSNSYVDSATIITWPTFVADFNAGRFTHNNFQGIINISGTLYELKQDKDGNAIDPNPAVLDLGTIVTGLYTTRKCFSQDPEFLNVEKRDYWSVANTSPMLFADSTGIGNIGNVYYTKVVKATDTEFSTGTITDLETSAGDFILNSPATTERVVSLPIQIAPIAQAIGRINFAELLNFNSSETLGTIENNNVTIVDNYVDGTAGANPRRLTYEMRWSNQSTIPTLDAHWDNQSYITAGNYAKFEQFTKPLIDVSGIGNGDPLFNATGAVGLKAKWIQVRVTMLGGIG